LEYNFVKDHLPSTSASAYL